MVKNKRLLYGILEVCIFVGICLFVYLSRPILLTKEQKESIISGIATVRYIPLKGGFYGLVSNDNKSYDPINLPKEFQRDGLKVKFKARVSKDRMSIYIGEQLLKL